MKDLVKGRSFEELGGLFDQHGKEVPFIDRPFELRQGTVIRVLTSDGYYFFEFNDQGSFTVSEPDGAVCSSVILHPLWLEEPLQINIGTKKVIKRIEMLENNLVLA